jgi:RNA polymerase sigma factor (sigma-70 family)
MIAEGKMGGLIRLFQRNRKPIMAFILRNSGGTDDAEDMLQEALIVLWERVRTGKYRQDSGLDTFVYATVRNLWLRQLSRKRREPVNPLIANEPEDASPSTLDILIESESSRSVTEALDRLPEPCRSILIAFYWEELSMEEIAARFGFVNAQTAKAKKYQCKQALKSSLQLLRPHG